MRIYDDIQLDYQDVLLRPKRSTLEQNGKKKHKCFKKRRMKTAKFEQILIMFSDETTFPARPVEGRGAFGYNLDTKLKPNCAGCRNLHMRKRFGKKRSIYMTTPMIIALAVTVFMIILIMMDKLPFGAPPLLALLLLVVFGVTDIKTAFGGFSNSTIVMLASFMAIIAALQKTSFISAPARPPTTCWSSACCPTCPTARACLPPRC